ncbi:hypothetical protein BD779DRAFT_1681343 [Infundibulicybe gibba]|nr:hypothetical protein BD779DRAFT_1681343 [Infundibulicybe gibba]
MASTAETSVEAEESVKGKQKSTEPEPEPATAEPTEPTPWQAIFSPQHNAYYFYNSVTNETTWENPLIPAGAPAQEPKATEEADEEAAAAAGPEIVPGYAAMQAAAIAQGIDPALAYLDPTLASSVPSTSAAPAYPGSSAIPTFTAKFNARTGQFARPDARDPSHLGEYERAKRMSGFYFDVDKWEQELASRGGSIKATGEEGESKKRKRLGKKDLERFREQKKLKKIAKTAWLRT